MEKVFLVYHKKDMLYKRRAHSLIYFNDFIYAISGVDKLEMIKKYLEEK